MNRHRLVKRTGDIQHLLRRARWKHLRVVDALEAGEGCGGVARDDGAGGHQTHRGVSQSLSQSVFIFVGDGGDSSHVVVDPDARRGGDFDRRAPLTGEGIAAPGMTHGHGPGREERDGLHRAIMSDERSLETGCAWYAIGWC